MDRNWHERTLTGWGRTTHARSPVAEPPSAGALADLFRSGQADAGALARGAGRSYGDQALSGGHATLLTARLDRILDFSDESGAVVCEAGVTFRQLADEFWPRNWIVPVSPGTAFATVGGAIANDVHGKNHVAMGSFCDHVLWIDLLLPNGETVRCGPETEVELFAATVGGCGLTGVILAAAFSLKRVPSTGVRLRERRLPDIHAVMGALLEAQHRSAYSVAWIDATARGTALGRGIVELAEHDAAAPGAEGGAGRELRLPIDLPGFALNPIGVRLFNELYYRRVPAAGRERLSGFRPFLYPLDRLLEWNRMYGRRGFHQFQCVLPHGKAERGIPALLERISAAGSASFLAVLKTLGATGRGFLSFPLPGFTLALDFPARGTKTVALLRELETLTLRHGGRVYLAKDSVLSTDGFRRMYPALGRFEAALERVDPSGRMRSDLSRRLAIADRGQGMRQPLA